MAADNGHRACRATAISAAMSMSEYRYGFLRWRGGTHPSGGTSVAGSPACNQRAKPRTTDSRMASHPGDASAGVVTHARANSLVTRPALRCSQ